MISGAMLLEFDKKYGIKTYFSKRFHKTVIPYIFWSIVGILFQFYYLKSVSNVDFAYIFNCFIIGGGAIEAYWFFIPLFKLYILFPIFLRFVNTKKHCLIFLASLFFINIVAYFFNVNIVGYSFLAVFGFYIHKYGISQKIKWLFYVLGIFGFIANFFGSYYLSIEAGRVIRPYIDYALISSMLYPCALFVFIKYDLVKIMENKYVNKIVSVLDFYTFGIFLIHWYILKILINSFNINIYSLVFRLCSPFIVILISVLIIYGLRKIPVIKNIIP